MNRTSFARATFSLVLLISCIVLVRYLSDDRDGRTVRTALTVGRTLGGEDTAGFARATAPRAFAFPEDHGPHPDFRNEWWYLTGNLESADGRRFGYQLTWFRSALSASSPPRNSQWGARQAWMAHFALTDVDADRFYAFEKFARGALDLAGATASPFRVWVEDWSIETAPPGASRIPAGTGAIQHAQAPGSIFPLKVRASRDDISIDLALDAGKPIVLNGEDGLSRKGGEPGNASYYYAFTRLPTTGTVSIGGEAIPVTGSTWLDREWSTSALADGIAGWDWFAIQLEDSTELMVYRLRRGDGSTDDFSAGTFVSRDGSTTALQASDFVVNDTRSWRSPVDGSTYPAAWSILVPSLDLDFDLTPVVDDQELLLAFRYWEGAVTATGTRAGRSVRGRGYVELTGYAAGGGGSGR